jgi:hypothetical protein
MFHILEAVVYIIKKKSVNFDLFISKKYNIYIHNKYIYLSMIGWLTWYIFICCVLCYMIRLYRY